MTNNNEMIRKSFIWMFFGLMLTSLTSWYCYTSDILLTQLTGIISFLPFIQLGVVIAFSFFFKKLSANTVTILFLAYALLTGVSFTAYFYVYELGSVFMIFMGSALLFLALGTVGFRTNKDLSSLGSICTTGLLVGFVMMIVNIFMKNSALDIMLTWGLLIIFMGLTVYDINNLKKGMIDVQDDDKMHIYFAMELYLDFINIFIRLMAIFGKEK